MPKAHPWKHVTKLERPDSLRLELLDENGWKMHINGQQYDVQPPSEKSNGLCIIFSLFRAHIKLEGFQEIKSNPYATASGVTRTPVHKQDSGYEEVTLRHKLPTRLETRMEAVENSLHENNKSMQYTMTLEGIKEDIKTEYCTIGSLNNLQGGATGGKRYCDFRTLFKSK